MRVPSSDWLQRLFCRETRIQQRKRQAHAVKEAGALQRDTTWAHSQGAVAAARAEADGTRRAHYDDVLRRGLANLTLKTSYFQVDGKLDNCS